jgi:hypothetical protein
MKESKYFTMYIGGLSAIALAFAARPPRLRKPDAPSVRMSVFLLPSRSEIATGIQLLLATIVAKPLRVR